MPRCVSPLHREAARARTVRHHPLLRLAVATRLLLLLLLLLVPLILRGLPVGLLVLVVSLAYLGTLWVRRMLRKA